MPESKTRKKADNKKVAKRKQKAADAGEQKRQAVKIASRAWVPWVFVPLALLGVIWLVVYYIAGSRIPFMYELSNWNFLIGLGCIAGSCVVAPLWKKSASVRHGHGGIVHKHGQITQES